MADHVEVKIEMMGTLIPSPTSSTHVSGLTRAELARQPSEPAAYSNSIPASVLPQSLNDRQAGRSDQSSSTSTFIPSASTDVSDSSDGIPPNADGLAPPDSMFNQEAPAFSVKSRTGSPLSPLPPDLEDDDHFSDTLSTTSSEVSSMSDTTCPSDTGSPPPISSIDDRPRSHSSEIQALPTVEAQTQPLLVTGGRDEGCAPAKKATGPPKLVEAARLNELIEAFDKWLQSPTTCTAAQFVKDVEKKVRLFRSDI